MDLVYLLIFYCGVKYVCYVCGVVGKGCGVLVEKI